MSILHFVIITLACWRITHLFSKEDGPFEIIFRLRKLAGTGFWGALMDCFYYSSVWVSLPFGLYAGNSRGMQFIYWMAFSGAACLLEQATTRNQNITEKNLPPFNEDEPCVTVEITDKH